MYIRRKVFSVAYDENGEEKLFSVTQQKEFNSKAQKARRAKWETENQSRPSQKDIDRQLKDSRSRVEKELDKELGIKDNPRYKKTEKEAIEAAKKRNARYENKFNGHDPLKDGASKSERKLAMIFGNHPDRPNTNLYRKEGWEDFNKGLRDAPVAAERKKKLAEKADEYEKKEAERKAKKDAESKASIAKHEAKAADLRAKNEAGEQLKKNLKKGGKIALATGGAIAAGIGAKKLIDKKKAKKEEKK